MLDATRKATIVVSRTHDPHQKLAQEAIAQLLVNLTPATCSLRENVASSSMSKRKS